MSEPNPRTGTEQPSRVFRTSPDGQTTVDGEATSPGGYADLPLDGGFEDVLFSTHILSLNEAALVNLGVVADEDGTTRRDLEAARLIIDTLAVLQAKTRGNTTVEEAQLLDTVLYELRLRFVQAR